MKKYIAALLLLCLAGCGAKTTGYGIDYKLEDTASQKQLIAQYRDISLKVDEDNGRELSEDQLSGETEEERKAHLKQVLEIDVDKELAKREDITDEIFDVPTDAVRVYRDKKHPEMLFCYKKQSDTQGTGGYAVVGDVLLCAEEYRPFIDDIGKKTGLLYSGTSLGKEYLSAAYYENEGTPYFYTGKNMISFANYAFLLQNQFMYILKDEPAYKDLPLKVNFYMDRDEIKYVNIFFMTNKNTNKLTENNLKQLAFDTRAAELLNELYSQNKDAQGTKNDIKYTYRQNITKGENNMWLNVLALEY